MKKIIIGLLALMVASMSFATGMRHAVMHQGKESTFSPGCEIRITNATNKSAYVYARYTDDTIIPAFTVRPSELHSIDMFYYGRCNEGLNLNVYDYAHRLIYSGFWFTNTPMVINYALNDKKALVVKKV